MNDTQTLLGKIIDGPAERDAIHIAVAPVIASDKLYPSQPVGLLIPSGEASAKANPIGIVDPFLKAPVFGGERFWLFLYPNTVTGMKHHWSHPAFESAPVESAPAPVEFSKAESEAWLRDFCEENDCPDYETVIAAASGQVARVNYRNDGAYLVFLGTDAHADIPPEFWHHVEVVTGIKIPEGKRADRFSCSC